VHSFAVFPYHVHLTPSTYLSSAVAADSEYVHFVGVLSYCQPFEILRVFSRHTHGQLKSYVEETGVGGMAKSQIHDLSVISLMP